MATLKNILLYAAAMAAILLLLQWMQVKLLVIDHATEIYITGIAVLFTFLGIWLAKKLTRPKTEVVKESVVVEKEVVVYRPAPAIFLPDTAAITRLGLSPRELEVLQRMAEGATNQEIADGLFVSVNTVKTHTLEVLQRMAEGATNQEIADGLFVSVNTVKTHTSRLFEKLEVKRRTQAIEKARRLQVIA
ncbi:MAG: DNA-binding response regulator [Chitinophagaceae bacterium]|nr:MAG: DNA-binding response regulator [Chitinophagaceae bacterium]